MSTDHATWGEYGSEEHDTELRHWAVKVATVIDLDNNFDGWTRAKLEALHTEFFANMPHLRSRHDAPVPEPQSLRA